jgi:ParB family chromosome partitioning protein
MNTPRRFFVSKFTASVVDGSDRVVNDWLARRGFISDGTGTTLCKGARPDPGIKGLELRVNGNQGELVINVDGTSEVDFLSGAVSIDGETVTLANSQPGGAIKGLRLMGCRESIVRTDAPTGGSTPPLHEDGPPNGRNINGSPAKKKKVKSPPNPMPVGEGGGTGDIPDTAKQLDLIPADTIVSIPVDRIRPNPEQPRKEFKASGIRALAESLRQDGQMVPIQVIRIVGDPQADYELVMGERRWRAAKMAGIGHLRAIVRRDVPDKKRQHRICLIMDFNHAGYNPLETALALQKEKEGGLSVEELGKLCGKSLAWVYQHLALNELRDEFREMLLKPKSERMPFGVACRLAKFPKDKQPEVWGKVSKQGGTRLQLLEIKKLAEEEGRSGPRGRPRKPADNAKNLRNFLIPRLAGDAKTASGYSDSSFASLVQYTDAERLAILARNLELAVSELAEVKKKFEEALTHKGNPQV